MANAKHLAILKEGVEVWNKWREESAELERDILGNDLLQPDLSETDLSEIDLYNANLVKANFLGADLNGAILSNANLSQANLSGADQTSANLENANLYNANLSKSDLSEAELSYANLYGANLSLSNLLWVDLSKANLGLTNLVNSNLSRADLSVTDFYRANLVNADMTEATLYRTNFIESILDFAKLTKCEFDATIFGLTDLSICIGLESIIVSGPCVIDFATSKNSKNLPKSFLLKIGLPELYIDYLPDFFQPEGIRFYSTFLSHSWANKPFARKLYEALIVKGVNVFFDEKKMKPGDDIFTSLSRGIELYDKTILVCSEESLNSWWVDQELELVFEKERNLQKEIGEKIGLLIPIRIDDHIDTWTNGKRMTIKQRVIGDFRNWQDDAAFEKALSDLIHALNADRPEVKPVSQLPRKTKS